ncbi:MAG: hypoxanthine phosphoribosyltransferase [Anaerolineae bacterium]|nr:hypoxanthine phosphoribosyltransferase [Anaerolineae bacterium]
MPAYEEFLEAILIPEEDIQRRVAELGAEISRDYEGVDQLLLVCILRGAVVFLADLMRQITVPTAIDFMAVSSYGVGARTSSGVVRILMDLKTNIEGRHVLIVEDIIDTGRTLDYITRVLQERNPASLKICCLLNKPERREVDVPIDYVGFDIPDRYVFGYGLDVDELWRQLPFVGVLRREKGG